MKRKIVYIEDEATDSRKYKRLFESYNVGDIRFEVFGVSAQDISISGFFNDLNECRPDLFLIDLDLSKQRDNVVFGLSGASISNILREKFSNIPIIIFTGKDIIRNKFPSLDELIIGVDEVIFKEEIRKNLQKYIELVLSLIDGYETIRDVHPDKFNDLLTLINAPKCAFDLIKIADPPLIHGREMQGYIIAQWIRKSLLKYPGILYDPIHAAVLLGISKKAFLSDGIQDHFRDARYDGIFKPIEGRWWKSKLNILAMDIMNDNERELALRNGFPLAWDRTHSNGNIEPSRCNFRCESPAEWVCCILEEPMMLRYSLAYRADSRPRIMDEARVSYKAIKTSNDFKEELILDPLEVKTLPEIHKMKRKRC